MSKKKLILGLVLTHFDPVGPQNFFSQVLPLLDIIHC